MTLPNSNEAIIASYQTSRIRALWSSYKRIFRLLDSYVVTLDPADFRETNRFEYISMMNVQADPTSEDRFSFDWEGQNYIYATDHRSHLLCKLYECISKCPDVLGSSEKHKAKQLLERDTVVLRGHRFHKNGHKTSASLKIVVYGIIECDTSDRLTVRQEYPFVNISHIGTDDWERALFFKYSDSIKIFTVDDINAAFEVCRKMVQGKGFSNHITLERGAKLEAVLAQRKAASTTLGASISTFDVNKKSRRQQNRLIPRQMHVAETVIFERDAAGFRLISSRRMVDVYALVRSWSNPREFTIEYNDGTSRTYTCPVRDTLLAMVRDIAHAAGNTRVSVTADTSDAQRLIPRFATEQLRAQSFRENIFGAESIESWYLKLLDRTCSILLSKGLEVLPSVIDICRAFNANVPCPGVSKQAEAAKVKSSLLGLMKCLHLIFVQLADPKRTKGSSGSGSGSGSSDNKTLVALLTESGPACLALIMQTVFRVLHSPHGYKGFVEIVEVDTRVVILRGLRFGDDFVNYWALELLNALCRGSSASDIAHHTPEQLQEQQLPQQPEQQRQQEFINKHALLTDGMLISLVDLMSRDHQEENEAVAAPQGSATDHEATATSNDHDADTVGFREMKGEKSDIIPDIDDAFPAAPAVVAHQINRQSVLLSPEDGGIAIRPEDGVPDTTSSFFPNSLVIVGASSLLESVLASRRHTSSPELMNNVLDLLSQRHEILIHMLRSKSFLIMESAALLLHVLLKNRISVGKRLKEAALSEALVIRHFHDGVFSASSSQRFISRFLFASWASDGEFNAAKELLRRMLPSGLIEYLKKPLALNASLGDLDSLEEPYYARLGDTDVTATRNEGMSTNVQRPTGTTNVRERMRQRISTTLSHPLLRQTKAIRTPSSSPNPSSTTTTSGEVMENFRLMFHVMVKDHKLPDLIWNEQTRTELRNALENELRGFEREQRLRGAGRVAWNYQQFHVRYDSLREELRVGSIYIRYFLEADDTFIRALSNPSHGVLFEKLLRRILVNVEKNPSLSTMCTRCLCRLYFLCSQNIGFFDDMMITVRMLQQAVDMELQHALLDLVEQLTVDALNLEQLLDKDFVRIGVRFSSLAHLNPDQIGNMLARSMESPVLALQSQSQVEATAEHQSTQRPRDGVPGSKGMGPDGVNPSTSDRKRSLWVPDDVSCPRCWFVANIDDCNGTLPPPESVQKGPFLVSELFHMVQMGEIDISKTYAAPSVVEDYDEDAEIVVDKGRWQAVMKYFQLRMQICSPGRAIYSPAEVAAKGLRMLRRLAALHHSVNSKNVPFFPIPESKRIMSDPEDLAVYAQLLLSNDSRVVSIAADLLRTLVEFNVQANSTLYLTGAFFFGCRYTGHDMESLANLFYVTHISQGFHNTFTSAEQGISSKSVLGSILPEALITILENYGPERFSTVFTGEFDTPEVIWSAAYRRHVVMMIDQHIGDFIARLRQYTLARYEYCPIPKIRFVGLDKEIYCHEYYLRNLCDEQRFKDWPIAQPLILLREVINRWRQEADAGCAESTEEKEVQAALEVLGLNTSSTANAGACGSGGAVDSKRLRLAYRKMARKYHPDKNPNGRDVFEKVQAAYELLVEVVGSEDGVQGSPHGDMALDMYQDNVVLMIQTQIIIYRRFPETVCDQKYPCFDLLLNTLQPWVDGESLNDHRLREAGMELVHYTCMVSPLNARELVRSDGVTKLFALLCDCLVRFERLRTVLQSMEDSNMTRTRASVEGNPHRVEIASIIKLLAFVLKALSVVCNFESGRNKLLVDGSAFALAIVDICKYVKDMPLAVEAALEIIAHCAVSTELQDLFIDAGAIWRLVPMVLAFDVTLGTAFQEEKGRSVYNQHASNAHGVCAARALSQLSGYSVEAPTNMRVRLALNSLLTAPISQLLADADPAKLLNALNENVECANKIWNLGMREELLEFVRFADNDLTKRRDAATDSAQLSEVSNIHVCSDFGFTALLGELCVGGMYVRIFVKDAIISDVPSVSTFCRALIDYLWRHFHAKVDNELCTSSDPAVASTDCGHSEGGQTSTQDCELAFEAIRILVESVDKIAVDIVSAPYAMVTIFAALDLAVQGSSELRMSAARSLSRLCKEAVFVEALCAHRPHLLGRLLAHLCGKDTGGSAGTTFIDERDEGMSRRISSGAVPPPTASSSSLYSSVQGHLWMAADSLAASVPGHAALLDAGAIVHLLGAVLYLPGYACVYQSRSMAVSLLSSLLTHPVCGPAAGDVLNRFFPEPVINLFGSLIPKAMLDMLDKTIETPEVIWTADMRSELRQQVLFLAIGRKDVNIAELQQRVDDVHIDFQQRLSVPADFHVVYAQLETEVYIGGVYIRLFLKQPTFRLTNAVIFLEKIIEFWGASFDHQVPPGTTAVSASSSSSFPPSAKEVERDAYTLELALGLCGSSSYGTGSQSRSGSAQTQIVLTKEDFLSLVTSCIVCVVRSEVTLVGHLLSWGFARSLCERFRMAVDIGRVGSPVTAIVRILHQMLSSSGHETADELAQAPVNIFAQFVRVLDPDTASEAARLQEQRTLLIAERRKDSEVAARQAAHGTVAAAARAASTQDTAPAPAPLPTATMPRSGLMQPLPKEATLMIEVLQLLFSKAGNRRALGFLVHLALVAGLPTAMLNVLSATAEERARVRSPQGLTVHAVETLKSMVEGCDATNAALLHALLKDDPVWDEYRGQSHDLFLTHAGMKVADTYLIEDASHDSLVKLLEYTPTPTPTPAPASASAPSVRAAAPAPVGAQTPMLTSPASKVAAKSRADVGDDLPTLKPVSKVEKQTSIPTLPSKSAAQVAPRRQEVPPPPDLVEVAPTMLLPVAVKMETITTTSSTTTTTQSSAHVSAARTPKLAPTPVPFAAPVASVGGPFAKFEVDGAVVLSTTITRGKHGIGIDLGKNRAREAVIQKLKTMPDGSANPAEACNPPLTKGDRIVGVDGCMCEIFEEVVTAIKKSMASSDRLDLVYVRIPSP